MNRDQHMAMMPKGGRDRVNNYRVVTPQEQREQKIARNAVRKERHAMLLEALHAEIEQVHALTRDEHNLKIQSLCTASYAGAEENRRLLDYGEKLESWHSKLSDGEMRAAFEIAFASFNAELVSLGKKPLTEDDPLATLLARMAFVNDLFPYDPDASAMLACYRILKNEGCLTVSVPHMPVLPPVEQEIVEADPEIAIQAEMQRTPNPWDRETQPARWESYQRQNRYEAEDRLERRQVTEAHNKVNGSVLREGIESLALPLNFPSVCQEQIVAKYDSMRRKPEWSAATVRRLVLKIFGDQFPRETWNQHWTPEEIALNDLDHMEHLTAEQFAKAIGGGNIPALNDGGVPRRSLGV